MSPHFEYGDETGDWRDRYDDRIRCDDCQHLGWRNARFKTPPTDETADPRTAHGVEYYQVPTCRAGYSPLPGRLFRCSGFASKG
jgi:hypothetical protein